MRGGGQPGLHAGFGWNTVEGSDQVGFQQLYTRAVAEWAQRFGSLLDGWWFDGCYTWPVFHNSYLDWELWLGAARLGNPEAAVAFNDGSFCTGSIQPVYGGLDYLSGEVEMLVQGRVRLGRAGDPPPTHLPAGRFVSGTQVQWHALLPVDCFWGHGNPPPTWLPEHRYHEVADGYIREAGHPNPPMELPVYTDLELGTFLKDCLEAGGAVTLNVGIFQEGHYGIETVRQLQRMGKLNRQVSVGWVERSETHLHRVRFWWVSPDQEQAGLEPTLRLVMNGNDDEQTNKK